MAKLILIWRQEVDIDSDLDFEHPLDDVIFYGEGTEEVRYAAQLGLDLQSWEVE